MTLWARLRRLRIFRYFITGGAAAVVDAGVFWWLHQQGLSVAVSATLSFLTSAVVNYLLTSRHVFARERSLPGFLAFLAAAAVGLSINVGVTVLGANLGLLPLVAKIVGTGVAFLVNFGLNAGVVFRVRPQKPLEKSQVVER